MQVEEIHNQFISTNTQKDRVTETDSFEKVGLKEVLSFKDTSVRQKV